MCEVCPGDHGGVDNAADQIDDGLIAEMIAHLDHPKEGFIGEICEDDRAVQDEKAGCGRIFRQPFGCQGRKKDERLEMKRAALIISPIPAAFTIAAAFSLFLAGDRFPKIFHNQFVHPEGKYLIQRGGEYCDGANHAKPRHSQQAAGEDALNNAETHAEDIAAQQIAGIADHFLQ